MRTLTIKRAKSFVGCLGKMKVYIEDHEFGELTINNVPCRKLGDLKNGEEKTFAIGEGEAKVFVIADKLSKNYCNEFYPIPAGEENIFLTGKNVYNPVAGNPFRFDGVNSADVLQNRKRGTRKGVIIMIVAVLVGFAIGLLNALDLGDPEPKTFSIDGMSITLTDAFDSDELEDYDVVFDSRDVAVFVVEDDFASVPGLENCTLEEYGEMLSEINEWENNWKTENGLTYHEFSYEDADDTFHYFAMIYKTDDAFWLIQFGMDENDLDDYRSQIFEWAKSVKFTD